jgi:hypothetical protein
MQEQIAEKKESMRILKERMAEAAQAAEEAKASVQKEWGKLLEGGCEEGVEEGGKEGIEEGGKGEEASGGGK